jgi:predicted DNA-binding transcriptional regulator AlpA
MSADSRTIERPSSVANRLGVTTRTIKRWETAGLLPKRIHIGPRCVGYLRSSIDEYIAQRVAESRGEQVAA